MKEYNKYLIIGVVIIIIALLFYYFSNLKEESFTHKEEQIITAQLLAANGGFIPQTAIGGSGNPDDISQYKYMNSSGINVNAMPLNVQQLTNPLCFNDVLHSRPYTSSNKKGGAYSKGSTGSGLTHDKFEKDETPSMKQLIKANDQLIDANEELLILAGKGEHEKKHQEKRKKEEDKMKRENKKYSNNGYQTGNVAPLSLTISVNSPGSGAVPINVIGGTGTTTSSALTSGSSQQNSSNQRSTAPTYSSIYEEQVTGSTYTKCVNRGYSSEYCNNMYGEQYDKTPDSTPSPSTTTTPPVVATTTATPVVATTTATVPSPANA